MIVLVMFGWILLPVCGIWDLRYAKYPVIPRQFFRNRSIIIVSLIGAFDFVSFSSALESSSRPNSHVYAYVVFILYHCYIPLLIHNRRQTLASLFQSFSLTS